MIEGIEIFIVHVLDIDGARMLGAGTSVAGARAIAQRQANEWAEMNDQEPEIVRWKEPVIVAGESVTILSEDVLDVQFEITSTLLEG